MYSVPLWPRDQQRHDAVWGSRSLGGTPFRAARYIAAGHSDANGGVRYSQVPHEAFLPSLEKLFQIKVELVGGCSLLVALVGVVEIVVTDVSD